MLGEKQIKTILETTEKLEGKIERSSGGRRK
jgi:hypothetical protein